MGPDRHVGMRLSACSTKRRNPGFASGMWPHTVSMRPHTRRDAWISPRGRAPGATPKSRHARENLSLRFTVPLLFSTSKTTVWFGLVWFVHCQKSFQRAQKANPPGNSFDVLGSMSRTCALVAQTDPLFRSARTGLGVESAMFRFVQLGHPSLGVGVGFGLL